MDKQEKILVRKIHYVEGQVLGNCIFIKELPPQKTTVWNRIGLFKCECGKEFTHKINKVKYGLTTSCGCHINKFRGNVTHGKSITSEFKIWCQIKARCFYSKNKAYKWYGGRGITMCERWKNNFEYFLSDVGVRPSKKHSLDRIDNNGNYEPGNCRWATQKEQALNMRSNKFLEKNGERLTYSQWAKKIGISPSSLGERVTKGWTIDKILSTDKFHNSFPKGANNPRAKKVNLTIICLLLFFCVRSQTANNFPLSIFTQSYGFNSNTGFYGFDSSNLNNDSLAQLQWNAGCRNLRVSIPDAFITPFGAGAFATDFAAYTRIGFRNMTVFLGGVAAANNINHTFPGCTTPAYMWRGIYDSIYHFDGSIDTSNTFANYVYKTVNYYKDSVSVWEIINEPMLCGNNANSNPSNPDYWGSNPPQAVQLVNLQAPIYYYIRLLRIAWTVIKTQDPTAHIAPGGLIATQEINVLGRYTDNPGAGDFSGAGSGTAGSVTADFPLTGSAYYDVQDMHIYPMFSKSDYSSNVDFYGQYATHANSDFALSIYQRQVHGFDSTSWSYGYNGITYPQKIKIITEMDAPKTMAYGYYGSDSLNVNFLMKAHLKSFEDTIRNNYKFALGDYQPTTETFSNMGLYKDLTRSGITVANAPRDSGFYANSTLDTLLYQNVTYSASKTIALSLPDSLDGVAFTTDAGGTIYAIWAKTTGLQNELATGAYTLPTGTYRRYAWNYSQTVTSTLVSGTVPLNGTVSIFLKLSSTGCCRCRRRH